MRHYLKHCFVLCILCVLFVSCESSARWQSWKLKFDGCEILSVQERNHCVFYIKPNEGIYYVNTRNKERKRVVDFRKKYNPIRPMIVFNSVDRLEMQIQTYKHLSYCHYVRPVDNYEFVILGDWGILAKQRKQNSNDNDEDESAIIETVVEEDTSSASVFLLSQIGSCYDVQSPYLLTDICENGKTIEQEEIGFDVSGNILPPYPIDDEATQRFFVQNNVSYFLFDYWKNNYNNMWGKGIDNTFFDFITRLHLTKAGAIHAGSDFWFGKFGKTYSIEDLQSGMLFDKFSEVLKSKVIEDIKERSVSFSKFIEDFDHNPVKAERNYNEGNELYISATLEKVSSYGEGEYKLEFSKIPLIGCNDYLIAFTKDYRFVELDYPCNVIFRGKFLKRRVDTHIFFSDERYYFFDNVELLLY